MTTSQHSFPQDAQRKPVRHPATSPSKYRSLTISPSGRPLGRRYFQEILDRKTGDLISVDQGDWMTVSELAELLSFGPRRTTTVLRHLGFLQVEGGGKNNRHRICQWVVERGWGKRCHRKHDRFPFDVISPEAVQWVTERWDHALAEIEQKACGPVSEARQTLDTFEAARLTGAMGIEMKCYWLADHCPAFTHDQIASCLYVTRQLIDRYMDRRSKQIKNAKALKAMYR